MLHARRATHTRDSVGLFRWGYVEKNTRGCAVPVADSPKAIGAGFAETGCFFARTRSSWSILRCSCGMGRLGCVIQKLFHNPQGLPSCLISNARFGHGNLSVKAFYEKAIKVKADVAAYLN
jgi:hypothetical protein